MQTEFKSSSNRTSWPLCAILYILSSIRHICPVLSQPDMTVINETAPTVSEPCGVAFTLTAEELTPHLHLIQSQTICLTVKSSVNWLS